MILRLLLLLFLLLTPKALCAAQSPPPIVPEGEIVESVEPILASLGSSSVGSVSWSPDDRRLASGSDDGTVRIWDVASGREAQPSGGGWRVGVICLVEPRRPPEACLHLATRPLAVLGMSYADPDSPALIGQRAGGRANLVAIACNSLIEALPAGCKVIDPAAVEVALTGPDIRQALVGWDRLSGQDAERDNRLDRIVVYATAGGDGFRPAELQQRLHTLGLPYTAEEVNRALQRLDLAYIIGRDPDGAHRYRVPLFIDMIREWDLDLALAEECEAARSAENR